ncbi:MAG: FadR family transcriptional regulator [Acidobacteria bacterium]|nr:FadR family transcriptional regulator [Acidobacteriota bacterium]MCI0625609.1 FadR family transcriptional regulator [Acidobacteriota bacterium]MCI0722188.1 FadR family transcriptional regulator [Acidobacteriota bacterium]
MLKAISRELTLVDQAQQQLESLILEGSFAPGDRLPSEKEMSLKLGVSRSVIREAVGQLIAKGLVETRTGSGIYVRHLGPHLVTEPIHLLLRSRGLTTDQILEVREVLEVKIAGLAAEHAAASDLEAMQETIEALKTKKLTAGEFAETDVAFHSRLAAAAGNPLFSVLADSINDVMINVRLRSFSVDGPRTLERAAYYHSHILDRVKARDVEGARRAMQEHLVEARDTLRRANASLTEIRTKP